VENESFIFPFSYFLFWRRKNMVTQIQEYTSAQAIAESLDKELSETKSVLGEYLRRLDEIRTLAEKSKKVREVVMKLAGKKVSVENPSEITVGTLNIILDANAFHELTAIEAVVRSYQERLLVLQKVREALKWLDQLGDTEGLKYLVLEDEGIPQRILFKIT
jgi:hypothetical protein